MKEFEAQDIQIAAISSDEKEPLAEMQRELGLPFPLLSDPEEKVIKSYGLLHAQQGNNGQDIARPAELLLDREGVIRWLMFTDNLRVRVRPEEVLDAAAKM